MDHRWRVVIITVDGRRLAWRKNDRIHTLSPELGPLWIANFKPAVFQVLSDGSLVPRGSSPDAVDVATVELEADPRASNQ
ncbi:MAG: hypothetical protein H0W83_15575 [Planctomycetes bacterium]|nr:hypothetical protein [Planctomycetota bacterium]